MWTSFKTQRIPIDESGPFAEFLKSLVPGSQTLPAFGVLGGNVRVAGRRHALLLFDSAGRPTVVVKVGTSEEARRLIRLEQDFFFPSPPSFPGLPRALAFYNDKDASAIAYQYVEGFSPTHGQGHGKAIGKVLSNWIHVGQTVPLSSLPVWRELEILRQENPDLDSVFKTLQNLPIKPVLFHGDFAPWNIRVPSSPADSQWMVLDWERNAIKGLPAWDWFHYLVQYNTLVRRVPAKTTLCEIEALWKDPTFLCYAQKTGIQQVLKELTLLFLLYLLRFHSPEDKPDSTRQLLREFKERYFGAAVLRRPEDGAPWSIPHPSVKRVAQGPMQTAPVQIDRDDSGPLRVLLISRSLRFHAGVPRCLLYLARAADRRRVDLGIVSFSEPSAGMIEEFEELGVRPQWVGDRGYLRVAGRLRHMVTQRDVQVIVATSFKTYLCAKLAARRRQVRVVFWLHAVHGPVKGFFRRWLVSKLCRHDPMLFVSQVVKQAQLPAGHRGISEVIYNGVEDVEQDPEYQPYPRQMLASLGVPNDALTLAYIASFSDSKDHPTAIAAMHELARRGMQAHLLLIGVGPGLDAARRQANHGPAAGKIHFLEARSDARRLLGLADLYMHPGRGEGFGLAVVEAMLAGVPVITARDGAFVEYITHDQTGMFFSPGNPLDLADTIQMLAANPSRARAIALAGQQYCRKAFDTTTFANSVCNFLLRVHAQRGAAAVADAPPRFHHPQAPATGG
jgi:glycosyltransferase involved in cell wall biosynthesis